MKPYNERNQQALDYYRQGLDKVKNTPEPEGQKFHVGARVHITSDLGIAMEHFTSGVDATVEYVYAHAFGGDNVKSYSLNINGGSSAWYQECQLTLIE
jgi:hypothetical protein